MTPIPTPTLENDLPLGSYSEEEKALILAKIEEAAGGDGISVEADEFRPRKQGILFPVLVNVAAVVLIAGAWFGANLYFQTRQEGLKLKTDKLFSAESKLLSKVLEDAKAQMDAANAEIDKIQQDLKRAAEDKAGLQKTFETRVAAQDKALRQELAAALAVEKTRLKASGLDETEVSNRLRDFEGQKNAEFNAKIEVYRKEAQGEIDKQVQALAALQTKLQNTVTESEKLRLEVEKQNKEREGALQSQLSTKTAELEALRKDRDELNLYSRQVDAGLGQVRNAFESRDPVKIQAAVSSLKQALTRVSTSTSEAVQARAQSEAVLAETLQAAAAAAGDPQAKAEAAAQIEALRAQLKKEQAQAAQATAEGQNALTIIEGLRADVDDLVKRLDASTSESFNTRLDVQYLNAKVDDMERTIAELTPYKERTETLTRLFTARYPTTLDRFNATFGSPAGGLLFPGFDESWSELSSKIRNSGNATEARKNALEEVRDFTTYLRGKAASPEQARVTIVNRALYDEEYKTVIEGIQELADSGGAESKVNADKFQLYGTVAAVSGTKIVLEPLTKVRPEPGQTLELRRVQNKKETVLGRGTVLTAADQKVEVDWAGNSTRPLSGDAAFLVLP